MHKIILLYASLFLLASAYAVIPSFGAKVAPLDRTFNRETLTQDLQAILASKELSEKQCRALQSYISIAQASNVNEPVAGRTYRQLYKQSRSFNPKKYESTEAGTPPPFVRPK